MMLGCVAGLTAGFSAWAGPRADVVSASWTLDFRFHDPQRISLVLPGDDRPTSFWYVLFEVANNTRRDVEFFPTFRVVTSELEIVEGGDEISPSVYQAVFERHKIEYPFLVPPAKVTGPILQGNDNARASVAIFREFDHQADGFTLYVGGLSGEMTRLANPSFDPNQGESKSNPRSFILRRSLKVVYDLPGDPDTRSESAPVRRSREWVMR